MIVVLAGLLSMIMSKEVYQRDWISSYFFLVRSTTAEIVEVIRGTYLKMDPLLLSKDGVTMG